LKEDQKRVLLIELDEPVSYGDAATVSYSGALVKTLEGAFLEPFSDVLVRVVSETPVAHVPGRVEAEDHAVNHGFEFEACSDLGGGMNAGYTDAGDYLDFNLYAEEAGYYRLSFRVASESASGTLALLDIGGQTPVELSRVSFTPSGGWQKWKTVSATDRVYFARGLHKIRLMAASSLFNINWMELTDPATEVVTGVDAGDARPPFSIFPNPSSGKFAIRIDSPREAGILTVSDISGRIVFSRAVQGPEIVIENDWPSGLYIVSLRNQQEIRYGKIIVK